MAHEQITPRARGEEGGGRRERARARTDGLPSVALRASAMAAESSRGLRPRDLAVSMALSSFSRSKASTSKSSSVSSPVGGSEYSDRPAAAASAARASACARADGTPTCRAIATTCISAEQAHRQRGLRKQMGGLRLLPPPADE